MSKETTLGEVSQGLREHTGGACGQEPCVGTGEGNWKRSLIKEACSRKHERS